MSSMYWTLYTTANCPLCEQPTVRSLQSKFMAEVASCLNIYLLGEPVDELNGITATVDHRAHGNFMIGTCGDEDCAAKFIEYAFAVEEGKVTRIWPVLYIREDKETIRLTEGRWAGPVDAFLHAMRPIAAALVERGYKPEEMVLALDAPDWDRIYRRAISIPLDADRETRRLAVRNNSEE